MYVPTARNTFAHRENVARVANIPSQSPIENWQHWNWQHSHIGNTSAPAFARRSFCIAASLLVLTSPMAPPLALLRQRGQALRLP